MVYECHCTATVSDVKKKKKNNGWRENGFDVSPWGRRLTAVAEDNPGALVDEEVDVTLTELRQAGEAACRCSE